jgi:uncharacterized repeat protein (TIGR03803 family)
VTNNSVRIGSIALILVVASVAQSQTFTVLYSFGVSPDGSNPQAALIPDGQGGAYGTTFYGGAHGYGALFRLDRTGQESIVYSFAGPPDGGNPAGNLVRDSAGNIFGATVWGGVSNSGTVFKVDATGQESVLYSFQGGSTDGANPEGGVIEDSAGNLYGTTAGGGSFLGCANYGCGIVFKLDTSGKQTMLYSFTGDTQNGAIDGANPWSTLLRDAAGNLYGTTTLGGTSGFGTIFKLDSTGNETLLHNFAGTEGAYPYAGLIADTSLNLYGTAYEGGTSHVGTIFKMDKTGTVTALHSFAGGTDGAFPSAGVVRDTAGNLYGITTQGGPADFGTVFKFDTGGNETVLQSFSGGKQGMAPEAGVVLDKAGNIYGTAYYGGRANNGIVFRVRP